MKVPREGAGAEGDTEGVRPSSSVPTYRRQAGLMREPDLPCPKERLVIDPDAFEPAGILARLEAEAASSRMKADAAAAEHSASELPLAAVEALPGLFQCRPLNEQHVADLKKAILAKEALPPIIVSQVGSRVIVLDGHHRFEALKEAEAKAVTVEFFGGSLKEAVLLACSANAKTKLPMTKTERTDAAWKFVLLGVGSKASIARASGVADRTVATMRSVKAKLGDEAFEIPIWARAMRIAADADPGNMTDEDREHWMDATAQRHADLMTKTFGSRLSENPEIAAKALAIHFGRRIGSLAEELREHLRDYSRDEY